MWYLMLGVSMMKAYPPLLATTLSTPSVVLLTSGTLVMAHQSMYCHHMIHQERMNFYKSVPHLLALLHFPPDLLVDRVGRRPGYDITLLGGQIKVIVHYKE